MSIVRYEVLLKVAETQNITKAADVLGYTQPGISQMITGLEKELGLTLLNRNKGGVSLTSEGLSLLPYIREAVNADRRIREAAADLRGIKTGFLRIGVLNSIAIHYLPHKLKLFREQYPEINFELIQGLYDDIEGWIKDGTVDLGFVVSPTTLRLDTIKLMDDPFYCVSSKEHRFKDMKYIAIEDMRHEEFVQTDATDYDFTSLFESVDFNPMVKYSTENDYAAIAMVQQGLGISVMPELMLKSLSNTICVKRIEGDPYRTICVAVRSLKKTSPLTRTFIDFLVETDRKSNGK